MKKSRKKLILIFGILLITMLVTILKIVGEEEKIFQQFRTGKTIKNYISQTEETVITPNGNQTWSKLHSITFQVAEGKYAIIPEDGVIKDEYKTFKQGETVAISGKTGKCRVHVIYENEQQEEISYISEPFYLDDSLTKVGTVDIRINSVDGTKYTTELVKNAQGEEYYEGKHVNGNLYIQKVDGSDSQSGHKSTVYTVSKILADKTEIVIGNSSVEDTIIENDGDYKITVTTQDNLGNKGTKTYIIHKGTANLIEFSNNGNKEYEIEVTTKVTIDEEKTEGLTLYYSWVPKGETPKNYAKFTSGQDLTLKNVSGDYVLWIKTVDSEGNENIVKSNVFHLAGKITTMGTMIFKYENENGEDYTPNTFSNKNIYLKIGNHGSDIYGGDVTSTYKITKKEANSSEIVIGNYTNESTVLINDGEYTVTLTSTSELGASSSVTYKVKIDKTAPDVVFTGVEDYQITGKIGVTIKENGLSDSGINIKNCRYYWTRSYVIPTYDDFYGTTEGGYRGVLTSSTSAVSTPNGVSGIWCLWILAEDNMGNYKISNSITIENDGNISKLDNTAPIVGNLEIVEDTEEQKGYELGKYTKESLKIKLLNGYDADSGVKSNTYTIKKNGQNYQSDNSKEFTLAEYGKYIITITTTDNNNNKSQRDYEINIDKKGPEVTFVPNGETEYSKQKQIQVTIDDENYSGVNEQTIVTKWIGYNPKIFKNIEEVLQKIKEINNQEIDNKIEVLKKLGIFLEDATIKNGKVVTPSGVTGNYYLYVYCKDNVGNETKIISNVYLLDNDKPTIPEIESLKQDGEEYENYYGEITNKNIKIIVKNSESLSGVDKYLYTISKDNGNTWSNWTNCNMTQEGGEVIFTEEGMYLVKFKAVAELIDGALESEETNPVMIIIDKKGPSFTFANYQTGENGSTQTIEKAMVRITATEQGISNINPNTLKYEWIKFDSIQQYEDFKNTADTVEKIKAKMTQNAKSFANGEELPSPDGAEGVYSLFAYGEDALGNSNIEFSNIYILGTKTESGIYEIIDDKYIRILPNTTLQEFITKIKTIIIGSEYTVFDKEQKELTNQSSTIATSSTIKVDEKTYTIITIGDLNEDSQLDVIDVSKMLNHQTEINILQENQLRAADINNDKEVDLIDLSRMMQIIVGLIQL